MTANLRELVDEVQLHPGRVTKLVERVLEPGFLPPTHKWLAGSPALHAARAATINQAIDTILGPAIERIQMEIKGSASRGAKSWEDVTLKDLVPILKTSLENQGELAPAALHKLFSKTCSLWEHTLVSLTLTLTGALTLWRANTELMLSHSGV